jgi:hypothetical protein
VFALIIHLASAQTLGPLEPSTMLPLMIALSPIALTVLFLMHVLYINGRRYSYIGSRVRMVVFGLFYVVLGPLILELLQSWVSGGYLGTMFGYDVQGLVLWLHLLCNAIYVVAVILAHLWTTFSRWKPTASGFLREEGLTIHDIVGFKDQVFQIYMLGKDYQAPAGRVAPRPTAWPLLTNGQKRQWLIKVERLMANSVKKLNLASGFGNASKIALLNATTQVLANWFVNPDNEVAMALMTRCLLHAMDVSNFDRMFLAQYDLVLDEHLAFTPIWIPWERLNAGARYRAFEGWKTTFK